MILMIVVFVHLLQTVTMKPIWVLLLAVMRSPENVVWVVYVMTLFFPLIVLELGRVIMTMRMFVMMLVLMPDQSVGVWRQVLVVVEGINPPRVIMIFLRKIVMHLPDRIILAREQLHSSKELVHHVRPTLSVRTAKFLPA